MAEETFYCNEIRELHNRIMAINDEVLSTPTADPTNMSFLSAARIDRTSAISGMANAITHIIQELHEDELAEPEAIMSLRIARDTLRKANSKLRVSRGIFE